MINYFDMYMELLDDCSELQKALNSERVKTERLWGLIDYLIDPSHDEEEKADMKFNFEMWLERDK